MPHEVDYVLLTHILKFLYKMSRVGTYTGNIQLYNVCRWLSITGQMCFTRELIWSSSIY